MGLYMLNAYYFWNRDWRFKGVSVGCDESRAAPG
jgi:hypothetical protein